MHRLPRLDRVNLQCSACLDMIGRLAMQCPPRLAVQCLPRDDGVQERKAMTREKTRTALTLRSRQHMPLRSTPHTQRWTR
eukprot:scaffold214705_cov17-Tisochrysis_lutea.AAC.1